MKIMRLFTFCAGLLLLTGCFTPPGASGTLGYSQDRRIIILGEKVTDEIAVYYQRRYDAMVWYTPTEGVMKDSADTLLKGIGPSKPMRSLINELSSINYTLGRWEIIIPKIGENYLLSTFKNMPAGALSHARGDFVLIDSKGSKEMEAQVARVTSNSFFVTYEFQKY